LGDWDGHDAMDEMDENFYPSQIIPVQEYREAAGLAVPVPHSIDSGR